MKDYPEFIKDPKNRISPQSQYTEDIEGYVIDGTDEKQVAFWKCYENRISQEHKHDYDEYLIVVEGKYILIFENNKIELSKGDEYFIPKGMKHSGECIANTRTIHVFNGKRIEKLK
jgi:mannose-6-phosphate isomerase-like protein (cupin superfamily)